MSDTTVNGLAALASPPGNQPANSFTGAALITACAAVIVWQSALYLTERRLDATEENNLKGKATLERSSSALARIETSINTYTVTQGAEIHQTVGTPTTGQGHGLGKYFYLLGYIPGIFQASTFVQQNVPSVIKDHPRTAAAFATAAAVTTAQKLYHNYERPLHRSIPFVITALGMHAAWKTKLQIARVRRLEQQNREIRQGIDSGSVTLLKKNRKINQLEIQHAAVTGAVSPQSWFNWWMGTV